MSVVVTWKAVRRLAGAATGVGMALTWATVFGGTVPVASAQPCPDIEVVFARGTAEPPGVGGTGQAFVASTFD